MDEITETVVYEEGSEESEVLDEMLTSANNFEAKIFNEGFFNADEENKQAENNESGSFTLNV